MAADAKSEAFLPEALLFEGMVTSHLDALYRTALRLTGRPQDAEDLVQDAYLRAWRSLYTYRRDSNPKSWLFRVLYNTHVDRYRAGTRTVQTVEEFGAEDPAFVVHDTPESVVLAGVMDAEVRKALMDLPEGFRTCVILAELERFSYREIADILGIPLGTVMSRLFRGRRAMRRALARYGRERGYVRAAPGSVKWPATVGHASRERRGDSGVEYLKVAALNRRSTREVGDIEGVRTGSRGGDGGGDCYAVRTWDGDPWGGGGTVHDRGGPRARQR